MRLSKRGLIFYGLLLGILCGLSLASLAGNAGDYRLGPGDVIKITVYNNPDLTMETMLSQGGDINFPLLGKIHLADLSASAAESVIETGLTHGGFVNQAQVTLFINQFRSQQISAIGEFNRPGAVVLDRPIDLLSVIAQVGGISPTGGDTVVVVRGQQRQVLSLSQLVTEPDVAKRTIWVANGDVVYAPRALIFVNGEVNRPGAYRHEANMTVMQAIAVAGGFSPKAARRALTIHRENPHGQVLAQEAQATDPLQQGDVIDVGESWF